MSSFIPDGYEFGSGFFPVDTVHDGLEVIHRAMTPVDIAELQSEGSMEDGSKLRAIQAKWLLKKIVRWQLPEKNGKRPKPPKLSEAILCGGDGQLCINTFLHTQLCERVLYNGKCDYTFGDGEQEDKDAAGN